MSHQHQVLNFTPLFFAVLTRVVIADLLLFTLAQFFILI